MQKGEDLVCSWLGLPAGSWPPDHYALLGIDRTEMDARRIEEHVHERLMRLRHHQLNHPEEVTEAMNRLARAFACLTQVESRRAYDRSLEDATAATGLAAESSIGEAIDPLAWLFGPWKELALYRSADPEATKPVRQADWAHEPPPPRRADWAREPPPPRRPESEPISTAGPVPAPSPVPVTAQTPLPATSVLDNVHSSPAARRGLATRAGLYRRALGTRRLLYVWDRIGRYLNQPEWRLTKSKEAAELIRDLHKVGRMLEAFPPLLGEAGQAGFWVAALARQEMIVPIFRSFGPREREALARDWRDGRQVLTADRRYLIAELVLRRRASLWTRLKRFAAMTAQEHPLVWIVALLVVAVLMTYTLALVLQ
jgi:hypothetical protein